MNNFNTPVRDFHNHQIHIREHNKFRNSSEYEDLDPQAQQMIDQHVQEHINMLNPPQAPQPGMNDIMAQLTPEERQHVQQNPQVLDQFMKNRGGI